MYLLIIENYYLSLSYKCSRVLYNLVYLDYNYTKQELAISSFQYNKFKGLN